MTYNEALAEILTWITDNDNKEITAAIMRDVLTTLLDYSAENIGDTDNLFAETNTVDAINALKSLIDGIDLTLGLQVHNGTANPNITPPSGGYDAPDIYVREDDALKEVYIFDGYSWIKIMAFSFPIYEEGIFKGNARSFDFSGGNFNLTYDSITGVMTVEVTGEGVDKLEDVGDVPAYPNDGQEWVLVELDGALTWELKGSGGGGQVDSVTGDSVDNSDPANPIVNAIPLTGTEVGSPVTGNIEFEGDVYEKGFIQINPNENTINSLEFNVDEGIVNKCTYYDNLVDLNPISITSVSSGITSASLLYQNFLNNYSSAIQAYETGIHILATKSDSRGLYSSNYFGANYTDNTYVQKKYVDDNFQPIGGGAFIPLAGTEVGSPVTGDIELNDYLNITSVSTDDNSISQLKFDGGTTSLEITDGFGIHAGFICTLNAVILSIVNASHSALLGLNNSSIEIHSTNSAFKGIEATEYYGANYDDNTYVQKKYVDDNFLTEADVIGTPRQYTAGQGTALGTLTIAAGSVTPDIAAKNAYSLTIDQNVTINAPSNDRCTSWFIRCTITGAGGWTIGLNSAYKPDGGAALTIPNTTGDIFTLYVQSFGDGTHDVTIHTQQ